MYKGYERHKVPTSRKRNRQRQIKPEVLSLPVPAPTSKVVPLWAPRADLAAAVPDETPVSEMGIASSTRKRTTTAFGVSQAYYQNRQ